MIVLFALSLFAIGFATIAKRLVTTIITAPMVFIAFGALLSQFNFANDIYAQESLHLVAEVALIVLLFLDAAQIDSSILRHHHIWPQRMLLIGLPTSIIIGAGVAYFFLPGWPIFALLLVAAILAPTDAALGQAVVTNPAVPERSRRALIVESGLNDGMALPLILLFASLTAEVMAPNATNWALFGAKQLILGPLVGIIFGCVGGWILLKAKAHKWTSDTYEGVGTLALAGASYLGATLIGGNGFIAAFVAGLGFGQIVKGSCKFVFEFTESEGQVLTWGAFFLLGFALVPNAIAHLTWASFAIIIISLVVVRPLAIWLSLIGTDASNKTRLFFGWFGPRGLATALFALLIVHDIGHDFADPILNLAVNAVWISALLHGITAIPGAKWYAAHSKQQSG